MIWITSRRRSSTSTSCCVILDWSHSAMSSTGGVLRRAACRQKQFDQGGAVGSARDCRPWQYLCFGKPLLGETVAALPHGFLRIVEVKHFQAFEADQRIESCECLAVAFFAADLARRQQMACIQAHAQPRRRCPTPLSMAAICFEARAHGRSLTRRVFQQDHRLPVRPFAFRTSSKRAHAPLDRVIHRRAAIRAPGWSTTPSRPSASARSTSSPSAAIDCARSAGLAVAMLMR